MLESIYYPSRKSIGLMIIGLIAFILYLMFFGDFAGFLNILSKLNLTQYALFYSLAIFSVVLALFFDSLIWYYLLDALHVKMKFRRVMLYNWIGNFVEMVIPCETVCGEATRIYLAQKEPQNNTGISSATVIGSRMISTFVYTGGLLIGFSALALTHTFPTYLITTVAFVIIGTVAVMSSIFFLAFKEGAADKFVNFLTQVIKIVMKNPARLEREKENIRRTLYTFSETFQTYRKKPKLLIKPLVFAILAWLSNLMVYLMVFYALNFSQINLLDLATIYCIAATVETLTAGFPVGAVEITLINMFALYGVPIALAVAATTLTRLITFWCQVLIGYPLINFVGLKGAIRRSVKIPLSPTSGSVGTQPVVPPPN